MVIALKNTKNSAFAPSEPAPERLDIAIDAGLNKAVALGRAKTRAKREEMGEPLQLSGAAMESMRRNVE